MLKVIIGIIIGYVLGVFTMSIMMAASETDDWSESHNKKK